MEHIVNSTAFEHIDLNSNNSNEFFPESWYTENDLVGLSKQRPKDLIIGKLNRNPVRNKLSSLQLTALGKPDIFLLSEAKIDASFSYSQFWVESFKMYLKDRTENEGRLLLYLNQTLPGKIINTYKFKKNSKTALFEFSLSNKKWRLLSNYKHSSQIKSCLEFFYPNVWKLCFA